MTQRWRLCKGPLAITRLHHASHWPQPAIELWLFNTRLGIRGRDKRHGIL
jgi:hypothetical protein